MLTNRRVSRTVGLSTTDDPSSLSRQESPALNNVVIDEGNLCRARDGIERLSTTPFMDASFRLRGAPYNASIFHEFYDAIVIPARSDLVSTGDTFYVSIVVEITLSGIGTALNRSGTTTVIAQGDASSAPATLPIHLYGEYSGGAFSWVLKVYDDNATSVVTLSVADPALDDEDIGQRRFIEFGKIVGATSATTIGMRVVDSKTGTVIGTDTDTFSELALTSPGNWLIGAYPDSSGLPAITSTQNYLNAKVAELLVWVNPVGSSLTAPAMAWSAATGRHAREAWPDEYTDAYGYWKLNDGNYDFVRDWCDQENPLYAGSSRPTHGYVYNVAPQWVSKLNQIVVDANQNPQIADTVTGISLIRRFGLHFGGVDGMVHCRASDLNTASLISDDPLVGTFQQTPGSNVGWTLEFVFTPLLACGETTYPNRVLYSSCGSTNGIAGTDLNPVILEVSSDQFQARFRDASATQTVTASGVAVSDFAGERVTLSLVRDNNSLTLYVTGINKNTASSSATCSGVPTVLTVSTSAASGPFANIGRQIATFVSGSDEPATYSTRAMRGMFEEMRLWAVPRTFSQIFANANKEVSIAGRAKLVVYLQARLGQGNELTNFGTSTLFTLGTGAISSSTVMQTRIIPAQESGPIPDLGIVVPFDPPRVYGAIDFRNVIGESTSRELLFVAGCGLYKFNVLTNELSEIAGGFFKRDAQFSADIFDETAYFANGGRPVAYDGASTRLAGITAPVKRMVVTSSSSSGTLNDGTYFFGYRWANTRSGFKSNMSPLTKVTLSGGNTSSVSAFANIETPHDPQVDAVEFFATLEGDTSVLYRIAVVGDVTSGAYTPTLITALTVTTVESTVFIELPNFAVTPPTFGDLYKFSPPPPTRVLRVFGARMLYASTNEPGLVFFSRLDGGSQVEHINMTPGARSAVAIKTDAGDQVQAIEPLDDSMIVYLRDGRAALSLSGLDPSGSSTLDIPYQVEIRDNDRGTVSPNAVAIVQQAHAFISEDDIYVRALREDRNISSPPTAENLPSAPNIGRTIREDLDGNYLKNAVAMHRQSKQQIWFAVTEDGYERNNAILIYSYRERKWMRYTMPFVDFILEVETEGDKQSAIGFVNGYVCKIDDTGTTGKDLATSVGGFCASTTAQAISAVTSGYIATVTTTPSNPTLHQYRWTPVVAKIGSVFYTMFFYDNAAGSGGSCKMYVKTFGQTLTTSSVLRIGSKNQFLDLMVIPEGQSVLKRFRFVDIAFSAGGNTSGGGEGAMGVKAWFDQTTRDIDSVTPTVDETLVIGSSTQQFVRVDAGGIGRVMRCRIANPGSGLLNVSEVVFEFATLAGKAYG